MAVVIGLQSTGESNTSAARDAEGDDMDDFVSAPRMILQQFLNNHFPLMMGHQLERKELDLLLAQVGAG